MPILDRTFTISRFWTIAKTETARLDGEKICGKFTEGPRPLRIKDPKAVCEEFANLPQTPDQILRFTRNYAPLHIPASTGQRFEFAVSKWIKYQTDFRADWAKLTPATGISPRMRAQGRPLLAKLGRDSELWIYPEGIVLRVQAFLTLIYLFLAAFPTERLRVCPVPACPHPYFVAHHLRQTFCGNEACIAWGMRRDRLAYWHKNKDRLRPKGKGAT